VKGCLFLGLLTLWFVGNPEGLEIKITLIACGWQPPIMKGVKENVNTTG